MTDLDSIFDSAGSGGGGGAPSYDWPLDTSRYPDRVPIIGSVIQGTIVDVYLTIINDFETGKPKLDKNGKEQNQVNLTLETALRNWADVKPDKIPTDETTGQQLPASADTGLRRIYATYVMLEEIAQAVRDSEQKRGAPKIGGKLAVKLTGLRDTGKGNPLREYKAVYKAPSAADNVFDTAGQAPAAAPAPAPAPAPAAPAPAASTAQALMTGGEDPFGADAIPF